VHSVAAAAEKTAAATAVLYMAPALHTAAAEKTAAEMAADSEEYHNSFHSKLYANAHKVRAIML